MDISRAVFDFVVSCFFFTLSHLLFFFFFALFLTSGYSIVTKIRPMEEDIAKLRGFHLHISHNTPCLLPKMSFISLRTTLIPRRNKKQRLRKVLGGQIRGIIGDVKMANGQSFKHAHSHLGNVQSRSQVRAAVLLVSSYVLHPWR